MYKKQTRTHYVKVKYEQKYHFHNQFQEKENLQLTGDRKNVKKYISFFGAAVKVVILEKPYYCEMLLFVDNSAICWEKW